MHSRSAIVLAEALTGSGTRMLYASADAARARYELLGGLKAQDVMLGARVEAARECASPNCKRPENKADAYRIEIKGIDRCARCRTEWVFVERGSLGVSIRGSSEGIAKRMHGQMLELAILGDVLRTRPAQVSAARWWAMTAAWELLLYGRRDEGFVAAALKTVRGGSVGASESTIDRLVREIRETVEDRLSKRKLLELP